MKFYHEVRGCSLAVDIVARELHIPLDIQWVNMETKLLDDGTNYLDVNSKGTVPTLQIGDGQYLTEGAIIMQYLADKEPENELFAPVGSIQRYRIMEWMNFIATDLHKGGFMPLFKSITPESYRIVARNYLHTRLEWLNDQLYNKSFLMGNKFTIADAYCYTIVMWTRAHNIDTSKWPHLESYLSRVENRSSVKQAERAAHERGEHIKKRDA